MDIELKDEERTKCEVWSRCMGYHRPVESYNRGKKAEFYERKYFTEEKAVAGMSGQEKLDNSIAAE